MNGRLLFAALALAGALGLEAGEGRLVRFDVGKARVDLNPSGANVAPTVRVGARVFQVGAAVSGDLLEGRRDVRVRSRPTTDYATERLARGGVRVAYARELALAREPADGAPVVGRAETALVFEDGRVRVRTVVTPAEPGRFRLRAGQPFRQSVYLPVEPWAGCEVLTTAADGALRRARFPTRAAFEPKAWGLNTGHPGVKTVELGFADFALRLQAGKTADFRVNRYRDGLDLDGAYANADTMHAPPWSGALAWEFTIECR